MATSPEGLMYRRTSMGDESERSCDPRQWTTSASSNARRRAQNRVAQRSHRERTKRRIEELEEQLSMCLNSEMFRMPSGASIGPQDQHSSFPVSKSTTNVDPHYRFRELDAWAENSILNSNQPHQTPQSDAKSFGRSIGECSTRSVPTSEGSPVEFIDRGLPEISMCKQAHQPIVAEGTNLFDVADFGSFITPSAAIANQPSVLAQPNDTQFPSEMACEATMYHGLDFQNPFYPTDAFPAPSATPSTHQRVTGVMPSVPCDTSVLKPQDRQEHILLSTHAAGYSNFDAAVVDYYTGRFDEGSAVDQAQSASRSTRLQGVLSCLSRDDEVQRTSDAPDSHVEIRRAAETLYMTDMAELVDNSKSSLNAIKRSGNLSSGNTLGNEGGKELPTVLQHQAANVWALLSQMTRRSERDVRDTSSPVACAILLLAWARDSHDLETPRMRSLLRLIQDSVPFKE